MSNAKKKRKTSSKRMWVRVMCIVLAVLLVGGTLTSVLLWLVG